MRIVQCRRGAALLIVLSIIILGGALLAGTASSARNSALAARSQLDAALADTRWRFDAAQFLSSWNTSMATLAIGAEQQRLVGPTRVGTSGDVATTALRLVRLDSTRYLLSAYIMIGATGNVRARRRASILLEAVAPTDNTVPPPPPTPISQWAQHTLY